uniref:Integrase catalytic domain-containing protein n=1 Tax=Nothobranchius rachovii TaxID=451742 RepID=A0A1A8PL63_9TELE
MPISIQDDDKVRFTSGAGAGCLAAEATVSAIADMGAQSDLWSLEECLPCGFAHRDLHPVVLNLSVAKSSPIDIEGAFFAKLSTAATGGEVVSCRAMIYVSRSVHAMYLSYDSLLSLGILPSGFPPCTDEGNSAVGRDLEAASRCGGLTKVSCLGEVCDGGMASNDIQLTRERCADRNRNAPSQAATPPMPASPSSTPFEEVFADFFDYRGHHYLVVGDRLSGWVEVMSSPAGTNLGGSIGLIRRLKAFFATFGVPEELSSDGGPEFSAGRTADFLRLWQVKHRVSSVGLPQSNGRAEVAVKMAKRLLVSNTGPTGSLDHDRFLRAMLQLRNMPDPDCDLSPAQIIFGRPLRDLLSFVNRLGKFSNPHIHPLWLGEAVFLQNLVGCSMRAWDRSGVVVESLGHDQYRVRVDGSGRLTLRNRRFLRAFTPATPRTHPEGAAPLPASNDETHDLGPTNPGSAGPLPDQSHTPPELQGTNPGTAQPVPNPPDVANGDAAPAAWTPEQCHPPPPSQRALAV